MSCHVAASRRPAPGGRFDRVAARRIVAACLAAAVCQLAVGIDRIAAAAATCPLDVWAVTTRCGGDAHEHVQRYAGNAGWQPDDAASLFDGGARPLVVLVHGNRYGHDDALRQVIDLARRIATCSPSCPDPRVVVYSWPSEKEGILLGDGRLKYDRARCEADRFATFLGRVEPWRPVGIVGYSYGALVTLGGVEAAVGRGADAGAGRWSAREGGVHLLLVASAVRGDALAPRGPYHAAARAADRIVLINNSSDRVLRFFPWIDRGFATEALGRVGMPSRWLPAGVEFRQYDAADAVGKAHRFQLYLDAGGVARQMCTGLLDGLAATDTTPCMTGSRAVETIGRQAAAEPATGSEPAD